MQDQPWLSNWENYYEILGVDDPKADEKEIKRAYEYKAWTISADRLVGAPEHVRRKAEEELKKVNRAYHDVLKDPKKRREYDAEREKRIAEGKDPKPPEDVPKPKPVVDPEVISFKDVKLGETRKSSFVIRNIGGHYTKIWFGDPDSWVKVVHYESVDPNQRDELPLRVYIEAKGNEWGKSYSEYIRVKLDEQETRVRVDLDTKPKPALSLPKVPTWAKMSALTIVGIIIVVLLATNFWPANTPATVPMPAPTSTPTTMPKPTSSYTPSGSGLSGITYGVGIHPYGICFDGANIWVANEGSNNVMKLKASDGSLVGTYAVGTNPDTICFDGINIWVANYGNNTVTKLRASDGSLVGTYAVGTSPNGICFDGAYIWTANNNSNDVTKLRASDGSLAGTYPVDHRPVGVYFDGANIWVTNWGSDNVMKLRASDGSLVGTYAVGIGPNGICFDGANIWVTNRSSNSVTEFKASDGSLVGTYAVGTNPDTICFDGINIWVANYGNNTVTKL